MKNVKNWFEGIVTLQELKKQLFKLARIHHPDIGGSTEIMQEINDQYDRKFQELKSRINYDNYDSMSEQEKKNYTYKGENASDFRDIIDRIIHLEDISLEVCGYWLWLHGETKRYKDLLKTLGFKWSPNKGNWYHKGTSGLRYDKSHKPVGMDKIRSRYGSNPIPTRPAPKMED